MNGFLRWLQLLAVSMFASASTFAQMPDATRGRALYENHCVVCHTSKVHARAKRLPATRIEVRDIVEKWQTQQNLSWSSQDVADVVQFLNNTQYKFD